MDLGVFQGFIVGWSTGKELGRRQTLVKFCFSCSSSLCPGASCLTIQSLSFSKSRVRFRGAWSSYKLGTLFKQKNIKL